MSNSLSTSSKVNLSIKRAAIVLAEGYFLIKYSTISLCVGFAFLDPSMRMIDLDFVSTSALNGPGSLPNILSIFFRSHSSTKTSHYRKEGTILNEN